MTSAADSCFLSQIIYSYETPEISLSLSRPYGHRLAHRWNRHGIHRPLPATSGRDSRIGALHLRTDSDLCRLNLRN